MCSWRHSGTPWACTCPRGAWQLGDRAGQCGQQVLPWGGHSHPLPAHLPLGSPGSLPHLTLVTHSCPDTARCHHSAIKRLITVPCPHHSLHLHSPKQRYTWHVRVIRLLPYPATLRSTRPLSKAQAKWPVPQTPGKAWYSSLYRKAWQGALSQAESRCSVPSDWPWVDPGLGQPPLDWPEAWSWPGTRAGPGPGISGRWWLTLFLGGTDLKTDTRTGTEKAELRRRGGHTFAEKEVREGQEAAIY